MRSYHELSKRQDRFCLNIFLAAFDYWTVQTQALHFVTLNSLLSRRCQSRPPTFSDSGPGCIFKITLFFGLFVLMQTLLSKKRLYR